MGNLFDSERENQIIKNEKTLKYNYIPNKLPHREDKVQEIARNIEPLMKKGEGRNMFIYGPSGVGKTVSTKWVLNELKEKTDKVAPLYVNCWNTRTKYFIFQEIAKELGVAFTQGKSADHVLQQISTNLKGKGAVFVLDEIDKAKNYDFLYQLTSMFEDKVIVMISNKYDFLMNLDQRAKSRLTLKNIEFDNYTKSEAYDILKERADMALKKDGIENSTLKMIAQISSKENDLRKAIYLLRESAKKAEEEGVKKVKPEYIKELNKTLKHRKVEEEKLNEEENRVVKAVKKEGGGISGDIFDKYQEMDGKLSYRSFKRYVKRLSKLDILETKEASGIQGRSTQIEVKD